MDEIEFRIGENEVKVLRSLHKSFHDGRPIVKLDDLPIPDDVPDDWLDKTISRFIVYGIITRDYPTVLRVNAKIDSVIRQIDNPTPRNHFTEIMTWWFSNRTRAWITVIFTVIPFVGQWIELLAWLLGLFASTATNQP